MKALFNHLTDQSVYSNMLLMLTITISPITKITTINGYIEASDLQEGDKLFDPKSNLEFTVKSVHRNVYSNYSVIGIRGFPELIIAQTNLILTDLGDTRAMDICFRCLIFTPIGSFRPYLVRQFDEAKPLVAVTYEPIGYVVCNGIYCRGVNA